MKPLENYVEQDLQSFHCSDVRKIHISKIDPSLLLGFYCQTKEEVQNFLELMEGSKGKTPIFSVGLEAPIYNDAVDLEHLDEGIDEDASEFDE